jgi:hypothetical protein
MSFESSTGEGAASKLPPKLLAVFKSSRVSGLREVIVLYWQLR